MVKKYVTGAVMALSLFAGAASASTEYTITHQSSGVFGSGNLKQSVKIKNGYSTSTVNAGMFHLTGNNGLGDFLAFCVDLDQYLGNPQKATIAPNLFTNTITNNLSKLFSSVLGGGTLGDVITTSVQAAGLQVAIWEVVEDSNSYWGFNLDHGSFEVKSNWAVKSQANSYLSALSSGSLDDYDMTFFASAKNQDLVTANPVPETTPVPVPAAGLMILSAMGALGVMRRRKKA